MADRLTLANALAEAKIDRTAAERIATEIYGAIHGNVATKADLDRLETATKAEFAAARADVNLRLAELEHRLTVRFASVMVVLTGIILAAILLAASALIGRHTVGSHLPSTR